MLPVVIEQEIIAIHRVLFRAELDDEEIALADNVRRMEGRDIRQAVAAALDEQTHGVKLTLQGGDSAVFLHKRFGALDVIRAVRQIAREAMAEGKELRRCMGIHNGVQILPAIGKGARSDFDLGVVAKEYLRKRCAAGKGTCFDLLDGIRNDQSGKSRVSCEGLFLDRHCVFRNEKHAVARRRGRARSRNQGEKEREDQKPRSGSFHKTASLNIDMAN